jgi:mycothiol synthase
VPWPGQASTLRAVELPAGYQLRAPEPGDLDGVAEVLTADELAEGGPAVLGAGFVRDEWGRAGFNLATDAWVVADSAGAIAGYVQAMADEPGTTDCWGVVHPRHRGPAGALIGHVSEDLGWVDYIAVLAASRGRGIGAALLRRSFAMFAGRGIRRVVLAVDAQNATGATVLYEWAGMRVVSRFDWWEQPVPTRR